MPEAQEALVLQCSALLPVESNSAPRSCDCLAHRFGNAGDRPDREPCYPSDMSDAEWAVMRDAMPVPAWLEGRGGQPEGYCHRQMFDAVRYLVTGGITWRAMPADFPAWDRVYAFAKRWRVKGLLGELHDRLRGLVREDAGRDPEPTAAIVDSQSVKADATVLASSRGYDAGKKINGRKRHIVVDCLGLLLAVMAPRSWRPGPSLRSVIWPGARSMPTSPCRDVNETDALSPLVRMCDLVSVPE